MVPLNFDVIKFYFPNIENKLNFHRIGYLKRYLHGMCNNFYGFLNHLVLLHGSMNFSPDACPLDDVFTATTSEIRILLLMESLPPGYSNLFYKI